METFYVYVNFFLYLILFLMFFTKHKDNKIGCLVLAIYLICAFASVLYYQHDASDSFHEKENISLFPFIYLFAILVIAFQPLLKFKQKEIESVTAPPFEFINLFAIFLIIISIFGWIKIFPNLILAVTNTSMLENIYLETMEAASQQIGNNLSNIGQVLCNVFSEITLFFSFYYITLKKKNKITLILLWFSSFYVIAFSFSLGLRSSIVRFVFSCLFLYIVFKPFIEKKILKTLNKSFAIIVLLVVIAFAAITISRFANNTYFGTTGSSFSVLSYTGQSFIYFDEYGLNSDIKQNGDNTLPLFRRILGLDASNNLVERQEKWGNIMNIKQGVFYTFIGDFVFDFGPIFVFVAVSILSYFFVRKTKIFKKIPLHKLLILFFIFNTCVGGIFYFPYKTIGGNLSIIAYCLTYFTLWLLSKKTNEIKD